MSQISAILKSLSKIAPLELAEEWDNVGLIVGRVGDEIQRVMTCLTLTPDVVHEAVDEEIEMIVTHHPIIFRPRQQITNETIEGALLLQLIQANMAVYSPHTAYDSARQGINAQLAELFELQNVEPIRPVEDDLSAQNPACKGLGSGRIGNLSQPLTLSELVAKVGKLLPTQAGIQFVGEQDERVSRVAIACGAAAEFQRDARRLGADVLITGEARFHDCLEARSSNMGLILAGHYATERPAVESLAKIIEQECPGLTAIVSHCESDPLNLHS